MRDSAAEKKLSLALIVDEKLENLEIDADVDRLRIVFAELLDNAIKFTSEGSINVECVKELEKLVIRFKDTGTAIPEEILPRLFKTFSTKSATDPTIQGAGLGLFICKAIIDAHGGSISAINNPDGLGAIFEISLPQYPLREYAPSTSEALT